VSGRCCTVTEQPFSDRSFDTVMCLNVLEHVVRFTAALEELRRALKPGGVFYGRVPSLLGVHAAPADYWRSTDEELRHIQRDSGFAQTTVITHGGLLLLFYNLLDPVWRRIGALRMPAVVETNGGGRNPESGWR
jgi:SAM-dependent methyltransferase